VKKRKGNRKSTTRHINVQHLFEALAYRILIMGKQQKPVEVRRNTDALDKAVIGAHNRLTAICLDENGKPYRLTEPDLARRIITALVLLVGTKHEFGFNDRFGSLVGFLGERVACDEKVFQHDTSRSGMIRVVPAKKIVGLWNYTMCILLPGGLPFLLWTRCHTELTNLDQHVTTIEILQQQIDVVKAQQEDRKVRTVMTHDSYYGTLAFSCCEISESQRFGA
jgi:hypothetical protein